MEAAANSSRGPLAGRAALVTGGSRGIGFGIASSLVRAGASVTITSRSAEAMSAARANLMAIRPDAQVLTCAADGKDSAAVIEAVSSAVTEFGRLDVLVNNAQQTSERTDPVDVFDLESVQLSFGSGFLATWRYMAAAFPHLRDSRGTVVNFGSGAAIIGSPGTAAYSANKEAIRGLSRVAAREWGRHGVTVNVIDPVVRTDYANNHAEFVRMVEETFPLGRFGEAELHVGGLVVFLASEQGSYLTGQTFNVDGGASMRP